MGRLSTGTHSRNAANVDESHIMKYRTLALLMPQHLAVEPGRNRKKVVARKRTWGWAGKDCLPELQHSLLAKLVAQQQAADVAMEAAADAAAGAAAAATTAAAIRSEIRVT